jgi:NAD(P)-dependent dehydrogenase (short-subunit alcohol dehydrogenase family)
MAQNKSIRTYNEAVAIVTGGASGIGCAIARELVSRGAEVILADLQIDLAQQVALEIESAGYKAKAVRIDVTDYSAVEQLVQETIKSKGRLDYIFNNAGIGVGGSADTYGLDDWQYIVNVNLFGVINGVQAAYPQMIKQGFGHIVNTASMAGLLIGAGNIGYTTTKFAVVGLSKTLRVEAAVMGVRVSVLCPGVIRTPILEGGKYSRKMSDIPPELLKSSWEKLHPMPPNIFAKKVLNAIAKNKAIIIVPYWWKLFWWLERISQTLAFALTEKSYRTLSQKFDKNTKKLSERCE